MGITTKLNRPTAESEHATETRSHRQHGGHVAGDSRHADKASGGVPIYNTQKEALQDHNLEQLSSEEIAALVSSLVDFEATTEEIEDSQEG